MTRQEPPHLVKDYLDKGVPVPIGLIYNRHIGDIGQSHQVVAYGYTVSGGRTLIYVYDNRLRDRECMLSVDTQNPGKIVETLADGQVLPDDNNGNWEGLLVEDGYTRQNPPYGQDLGIDSPQALTLTGPVVLTPIPIGGALSARLAARSAPAGSTTATTIATVPLQQQWAGHHLGDQFSVRNYGDYPAHYQSLGIEVEAPDGRISIVTVPAAEMGSTLTPCGFQNVVIDIDKFGDSSGLYTISAGYNSLPLEAEESQWLNFIYPAAAITVTNRKVAEG